MTKTKKLSLSSLYGTALEAPGGEPWTVSESDPVQSVMTDFHERSAVVVSIDSPIEVALEHMKHAGVRAAFVLSNDKTFVEGMITAYDIQGEKPYRHLQNIDATHRSSSHDVVHVRDVMDKVSEWQVLEMKDVEKSTIGMAMSLFESVGKTHIVVIERSKDHGARMRGLLSAAKIRRLLR